MIEEDDILSEIKRTTKENGGVPLGVRRFYTETGIKVADWKGKYWARCGDAVEEAGSAGNSLTARYDDNVLLEKLASLIRELGRYPVVAELRMKKRSDPSFPNEKTLKRFGPKQQQALRVLQFCEHNAGYTDVIEICESVIAAVREKPAEKISDSQVTLGEVYLLKSGRYHKIRRTNSVGRRERELAIQLPDKANVVHSIKTDDPVGIETYWHRRFENQHKNGEWYELSADDIAAFRRRKFM